MKAHKGKLKKSCLPLSVFALENRSAQKANAKRRPANGHSNLPQKGNPPDYSNFSHPLCTRPVADTSALLNKASPCAISRLRQKCGRQRHRPPAGYSAWRSDKRSGRNALPPVPSRPDKAWKWSFRCRSVPVQTDGRPAGKSEKPSLSVPPVLHAGSDTETESPVIPGSIQSGGAFQTERKAGWPQEASQNALSVLRGSFRGHNTVRLHRFGRPRANGAECAANSLLPKENKHKQPVLPIPVRPPRHARGGF